MKKAKITTKISKEEEKKQELSELRKLAYIFIAIIGVFLVFYGLAYLKVNKKTNELVTSIIQYDEILMSNLLEQKEKEYYVIVYNDKEDFTGIYFPYIASYSAKENPLNIYKVDMENAFNASFKSEISKLNLNHIVDIKISKDTMFKIKDAKIIKIYEGNDNIQKELEAMIK